MSHYQNQFRVLQTSQATPSSQETPSTLHDPLNPEEIHASEEKQAQQSTSKSQPSPAHFFQNEYKLYQPIATPKNQGENPTTTSKHNRLTDQNEIQWQKEKDKYTTHYKIPQKPKTRSKKKKQNVKQTKGSDSNEKST